MPLSEQEQRLLDEMERNLLHNDADVVSAGGGRSFSYRNLVYGALLVVVGLAALVAGVSLFQSLGGAAFVGIIVGVLGFALMFFGVIVAMRRSRDPFDLDAPTQDSAKAPSQHNVGFMDRMNDRWDRRHDPDH
ncbi:DUF3040 domain-containing protein [Microbacterium gorillae]|uniref:DUF3040 domain-containing protein n=1 Tax=Microbacterium gorillae TaxID=1231063 RepID=UPI00058DE483|nr:DUF3040 domain-containing protein [Microbacterium gorillae]